ncbi:MAG: hypothetical protein KDJ62_13775 [Rhodobiaceae bacterium]|nr:hypothetical protein [Rhodobiaceae bacterium]
MDSLSRRRFGILTGGALLSTLVAKPALAGTGDVYIKVIKGGWWFGGQGGHGTLTYKGRNYGLSVGGISAGLVFGAAVTEFIGTATRMHSASDIEGVYAAYGGGAAVAGGVRGIKMQNSKGVILHLKGHQIGLMANLDLSGMAIHLR